MTVWLDIGTAAVAVGAMLYWLSMRPGRREKLKHHLRRHFGLKAKK